MEDFDLTQVLLMAEEGDRKRLSELSHEHLVESIIMLCNQYDLERDIKGKLSVVTGLQRNQLKEAGIGTFNSRIRDIERQLTETEEERDRLKESNEELEERLQFLQERVDELEQELSCIPKAGRPERYDADFRARVKQYYMDGHTYRETAKHFSISTNTVGRFLKV